MRFSLITSAAALGIALVGVQTAQAATLDTAFTVRFGGIGVGKLLTTVTVNGNKYAVTGGAKTKGVASIVSKGDAQFSSAGTMSGTRTVPVRQAVSYKSRKRGGNYNLAFNGGNVVKASASPAIKYKPDSVPVKKSHLRSVIDPVSATVFPVAAGDIGKGRKVCGRTVPVFDGKNRFDLKFSYKRTEKARTKGFSGPVFVCSVRYVPVAGHRPHKKNIKRMASNRSVEVGLAQVGNTRAYTLFSFKVPTSRGTVSGKARRFALR